MVNRYCPKCNAVFDRKYCYDRHINKKFNCIQNDNSQNEKLDTFQNFPNFPNIFQNFPNNNIENINLNKKSDCEINLDINFNCSFCNKSYSSKTMHRIFNIFPFSLSKHRNNYPN
jgi:hypothetical protein